MKQSPILAAKQQLLNHPFDIYHDVFHHFKVWENARKIAFSEKLTPDLQALDLACWWHDAFRGDQDNTRLIQALQNTTIAEDVLKQVVEIIDEHSFGQTQTHPESQILFDADKIEYISLPRWQVAFEAYDHEEISLEEKERYVASWNKRVPSLLGKLHFQYSNERYQENYDLFVEWLKSINRFKDGTFVETH